MNAVPVAVVLSSYNEGRRLAGTIESLLAAETVPRRIVVVDDGSTDGSCERGWPDEVTLLRQQHLGIASARNRGAELADQPVLVFLDAHCTVEPSWLGPIVTALKTNPDGLVGAAVRDAREPRFVGCGARLVDPVFTYRWLPVGAGDVTEVGLVPGGCLAVRREAFIEAGGFAAFTGLGAEDVELSLRWWRAGRPLLGVSASVVTHVFADRTAGRDDRLAWMQNVLRTAILHLPPAPLRACLLACSRFEQFGRAVATVLSEPWIATHQRLAASERRSMTSYLERWAAASFR